MLVVGKPQIISSFDASAIHSKTVELFLNKLICIRSCQNYHSRVLFVTSEIFLPVGCEAMITRCTTGSTPYAYVQKKTNRCELKFAGDPKIHSCAAILSLFHKLALEILLK